MTSYKSPEDMSSRRMKNYWNVDDYSGFKSSDDKGLLIKSAAHILSFTLTRNNLKEYAEHLNDYDPHNDNSVAINKLFNMYLELIHRCVVVKELLQKLCKEKIKMKQYNNVDQKKVSKKMMFTICNELSKYIQHDIKISTDEDDEDDEEDDDINRFYTGEFNVASDNQYNMMESENEKIHKSETFNVLNTSYAMEFVMEPVLKSNDKTSCHAFTFWLFIFQSDIDPNKIFDKMMIDNIHRENNSVIYNTLHLKYQMRSRSMSNTKLDSIDSLQQRLESTERSTWFTIKSHTTLAKYADIYHGSMGNAMKIVPFNLDTLNMSDPKCIVCATNIFNPVTSFFNRLSDDVWTKQNMISMSNYFPYAMLSEESSDKYHNNESNQNDMYFSRDIKKYLYRINVNDTLHVYNKVLPDIQWKIMIGSLSHVSKILMDEDMIQKSTSSTKSDKKQQQKDMKQLMKRYAEKFNFNRMDDGETIDDINDTIEKNQDISVNFDRLNIIQKMMAIPTLAGSYLSGYGMIRRDLTTKITTIRDKLKAIESKSTKDSVDIIHDNRVVCRSLVLKQKLKSLKNYEGSCTGSDALISIRGKVINQWAKNSKILETTHTHEKVDTTLSCYSNVEIIHAESFEHVYNMGSMNSTLNLMRKSIYDAYDTERDRVHLHLVLYSKEGGLGKSHTQSIVMKEFMIPDSYELMSFESSKSNITDTIDNNDRVVIYDELGKDFFVGSKDDERHARLKQQMSQNVQAANILEIDINGRRISKKYYCEMIGVMVSNTNASLEDIESAMRRRIQLVSISKPIGNQHGTILESILAAQWKTNFSGYKSMMRTKYQRMQYLTFHIYKLIYCGILDEIVLIEAVLIMLLLSRKLIEMRYSDPIPGVFDKIIIHSKINCIQRVLEQSFFTKGSRYYGKPIMTLDNLMCIDKLLYVTIEDVVRAVGESAEFIVDKYELIVRMTLRYMFENSQSSTRYEMTSFGTKDPNYASFECSEHDVSKFQRSSTQAPNRYTILAQRILNCIPNMKTHFNITTPIERPDLNIVKNIIHRWTNSQIVSKSYMFKQNKMYGVIDPSSIEESVYIAKLSTSRIHIHYSLIEHANKHITPETIVKEALIDILSRKNQLPIKVAFANDKRASHVIDMLEITQQSLSKNSNKTIYIPSMTETTDAHKIILQNYNKHVSKYASGSNIVIVTDLDSFGMKIKQEQIQFATGNVNQSSFLNELDYNVHIDRSDDMIDVESENNVEHNIANDIIVMMMDNENQQPSSSKIQSKTIIVGHFMGSNYIQLTSEHQDVIESKELTFNHNYTKYDYVRKNQVDHIKTQLSKIYLNFINETTIDHKKKTFRDLLTRFRYDIKLLDDYDCVEEDYMVPDGYPYNMYDIDCYNMAVKMTHHWLVMVDIKPQHNMDVSYLKTNVDIRNSKSVTKFVDSYANIYLSNHERYKCIHTHPKIIEERINIRGYGHRDPLSINKSIYPNSIMSTNTQLAIDGKDRWSHSNDQIGNWSQLKQNVLKNDSVLKKTTFIGNHSDILISPQSEDQSLFDSINSMYGIKSIESNIILNDDISSVIANDDNDKPSQSNTKKRKTPSTSSSSNIVYDSSGSSSSSISRKKQKSRSFLHDFLEDATTLSQNRKKNPNNFNDEQDYIDIDFP
jgi:hypothetical protein